MQNIDLLWVNTDAKSRNTSLNQAEERFLINSHIQRYRKKIQPLSKASVNDSSRTAIIANSARSKWKLSGCNLRSTSTKQSEVLHRSPSAPNDHANSESHIEPVKKRGHQTVPRNFCGKGKSVDPFDCSAHKFDPSTFDLMQFYLAWGRPIANKHKSYGLVGNMIDKQVDRLVKSCISNKLRNHALFSLIAAIMGLFDINQSSFQRQGILHDKIALEILRRQIHDGWSEPQALLDDIALLCRAATERRNYFAALTHLHALKHIVGQAGGFQTVDVMTTRIVIFADKRLAYARLEAPVFTMNQQLATLGMTPVLAWNGEPSGVPPDGWHPSSSLEQLASGLILKLNELSLPQELCRLYQDIILYAQVLESTWADLRPSNNASWLTAKNIVITTRLLSMSLAEEENTYLRLRYEAMRSCLILWDLLIMAGTSKGHARYVLPEIADTTLEAKKRTWPPHIYEGFKNWNRTLRAMPFNRAANDSRTFLQLSKVVREMEFDNEVRLGDFMMCLHRLEQKHHSWMTKTAAGD